MKSKKTYKKAELQAIMFTSNVIVASSWGQSVYDKDNVVSWFDTVGGENDEK